LSNISLPWEKKDGLKSGFLKNGYYLLSDMDEDDVLLKSYKSKLRNAGKIGLLLLIFMMIIYIYLDRIPLIY